MKILKMILIKTKYFDSVPCKRMLWLADQIVSLMPEEKNRKQSYYDVGQNGQPRGWLHEAYKQLRSKNNSFISSLKLVSSASKQKKKSKKILKY